MNLNNRALNNWYDRFSLIRHPQFGLLPGQQHNGNLNKLASHLQNQEHSKINSSSNIISNRNANAQTASVKEGNLTRTNTTQTVVDTVDINSQKQLSLQSEQVVESRANGKDTYQRNLKDTEQTVNERRQSTTNDNKTASSNTTRDVQKTGQQTRVSTHTDNTADQQTTAESLYGRQTDTITKFKTYDKTGKLTGEKYNRQTVDTEQATTSARSSHSEGTRDIEQNSSVVQLKEGNSTIRKANTETTDVTKNQQTINGQTGTHTDTVVKNLNEQGDIISTRSSSQQADSIENRVIDSERAVTTEQESRTITRSNKSDTDITTRTKVAGEVTDQSTVQTEVNSYDQNDNLTGTRNSTRVVDTVSTEERDLVNRTHTGTEKNNNVTTERSDIDVHEQYNLQTKTVVDQDGAQTNRQIITQGEVNTQGDIKNKQEADGDRHVTLRAEQTKDVITSDQTVDAKNQAKNVTTTTWGSQVIKGDLDFDAANNAATTTAAGKIIVDIGSNTGLRTSFKLDDGVLKFDFTAQKGDASIQTSVSSTGPMTPLSSKESLEDLHFTGQVVSSVDEAGNRVLSLQAQVVNDNDAVMLAGTGYQTEDRESEYEITGSLKVNTTQTKDGNTIKNNVTSSAELNVNKVENLESTGYNVRNLTALTNADAVKAGFVSSNNAIRFNFGTFNIGISFQA